MSNCPLCQSNETRILFNVKNMPVFPNMVFPTPQAALAAPVGEMTLTVCDNCGFVYNQTFDAAILDFNGQYDNEQKHSAYYQNYLKSIITLLKTSIPDFQKVAEIGCGKGYFLEMLLEEGIDAIGYDPAYEGDNPKVVKDYFSEKYSTENADLIILRHILYTVLNPFELLHTIAKANHYKGKIYIEVLDFEWIANQNSFCDICYEQVVYFTKDSLASFFSKSVVGNIFGGQYIYLIADLADLHPTYQPSPKGGKHLQPQFETEVLKYKQLIQENAHIIVWGAGGKGVSFTHIIDPMHQYIPLLIDINPNKQGKFIAPHAHKVYAPEDILANTTVEKNAVFVVNPNYKEEIKAMINDERVKVLSF